jgi:hypothetical protein
VIPVEVGDEKMKLRLALGAVLVLGVVPLAARVPVASASLTCFGEPVTIKGTNNIDGNAGSAGDDVFVMLGGGSDLSPG